MEFSLGPRGSEIPWRWRFFSC